MHEPTPTIIAPDDFALEEPTSPGVPRQSLGALAEAWLFPAGDAPAPAPARHSYRGMDAERQQSIRDTVHTMNVAQLWALSALVGWVIAVWWGWV